MWKSCSWGRKYHGSFIPWTENVVKLSLSTHKHITLAFSITNKIRSPTSELSCLIAETLTRDTNHACSHTAITSVSALQCKVLGVTFFLDLAGMCTRPFGSRARRPWSPRPRCWQFKPRWDGDQGLQSSRRDRGMPTLRRDQAEALLRLETASRPRCQDRGHIPHPRHSEDWCSPKKKWGKPRTEAEQKWHIQA